SSIAADHAAASTAAWFCHLIEYQSPTSAPSPAKPINAGKATASRIAIAPRSSRHSRYHIMSNPPPARASLGATSFHACNQVGDAQRDRAHDDDQQGRH